jgi:lysophospholipase L1-like esterase
LEKLAAAFEFELVVIIHPIGFLQPGNLFVEPEFFKDDSYVAWSEMFRHFRAALSQRANVYDCSNAITVPESAYVDATHFSARGAAELADCIAGVLEQHRTIARRPPD